MRFSLRVESPTLGVAPREVALPEAVATIGRDAACTVVLQDPDKFVSRRHANITIRDGVCHFTVTSSANTAVVNGRTLACGQSTPLEPGDRISIPPFELTLTASGAEARAPSSPPAAAPRSMLDVDPFQSAEMFPPPPARAPEVADPFRLPDLGAASGGGGSGLLAGLDIPSLPTAAPEPLAPAANLDPLAALEEVSARRPIKAAPEKRFNAPSAPPPAAPAAQAPPAVPAWDAATREAADSLAELLPNPLAGLDEPAEPPAIAAPEHVHAFNLPFSTAPAAAPAPVPVPASRVDAQANIRALLEGLGLPNIQVPPDQQEEFLRLAGQITRAAIEGILAILASRSQLKKELGAENRTMLAQKNNNPLKVMDNPEEALRFLFDPGYRSSSAFLPPPRAIKDACDDIFAHEVALVAATRAAVQGAIRRFDPERLEQDLDPDKGGGLLSNKRARLWDAYIEHYRKLEQDMTDDIDAIFERDFLRAYMDQVKRLKR